MNRINLRNYLEGLIKESLRSRQSMPPLMSEIESSSDDIQQMATGKVSIDTVIDKLNFIRSGRSFKDEKVRNGLSKYLDALDDAEKTALLTFLKGISQIVTAEIPPEQAIEPADNPAQVSMDKKAKDKITIKPTVLKSGGAPSKEDTTGPAPIKPKK